MKHKKSLFITTVMMVVLLVAALSTATYAWYTSSNTVNTVATQVNSASSTGANISIGWTESAPVGVSSLTFYDDPEAPTFHPMVPLTSGGTFDNDTPFYTAVMSYGKLSNHGPANAYIGRESADGPSTFYVINYARVATNVKFSANITGENAARLRVAVFNAKTGELVFTNAGYYTGTIVDRVPMDFELLEEEPADWADNFGNKKVYSSSTGESLEDLTAISAVAPEFEPNMYYKADGSVALEEAPTDWAANYANYSTDRYIMIPVVGVAPAFNNQPVYAVTLEVPEHMTTSASVVSPIAINTPIAASENGVVGVAQGFIVKAWFDGPTQVDAYGGMPARFALTVTATNVGGGD